MPAGLFTMAIACANCSVDGECNLFHCGGNDIGLVPYGALLFHLKFAIYVISNMLPGCKVIFSGIWPRRNWT